MDEIQWCYFSLHGLQISAHHFGSLQCCFWRRGVQITGCCLHFNLFFHFLISVWVSEFFGLLYHTYVCMCVCVYSPRISVRTKLKTRSWNGPFLPSLLAKHLAHSLDRLGLISWLDWASPIRLRSKDNALWESTCRALIGAWC